MKALDGTKQTDGIVIPPLPEIEWEQTDESTFEAGDSVGNKFWKWTVSDPTFYLVELNPDRYGLGTAQSGKSLEEAWEKALTKVITEHEVSKSNAVNNLKTIISQFNNVPVDQVTIHIQIEKKGAA